MMLRKTNNFMKILNSTIINLPTRPNISYMWNMGFLLSMCLMIRILSGLFLAMHFSSDISTAFSSVSHISRDVNYGWLIRAMHANSLYIFHPNLHSHRTKNLLFIILINGSLIFSNYNYSNDISWVRLTTKTNIILSSNSNYKSTFSNPMCWNITQWIWGGFSVNNLTLTHFSHYIS